MYTALGAICVSTNALFNFDAPVGCFFLLMFRVQSANVENALGVSCGAKRRVARFRLLTVPFPPGRVGGVAAGVGVDAAAVGIPAML